MTKLFRNRYRVETVRMKSWDYSWSAPFFITITTKNWKHFFGKITNGKMLQSEIGQIAYSEWQPKGDARHHGSADNKNNKTNPIMNQFGPQSKNLASIIRGFKSSVTRQVRQIEPEFQWHQRYYNHIIRNEMAFTNISNYIKSNVDNWGSKNSSSK